MITEAEIWVECIRRLELQENEHPLKPNPLPFLRYVGSVSFLRVIKIFRGNNEIEMYPNVRTERLNDSGSQYCY